MKKLLCLLLLSALAGTAVAGTLSPGLKAQLADLKPDQTVKVLVVLKDQVDVARLDHELHAAKTTLAARHRTVVGALQDKAATTQSALLADLQSRKAAGGVLGFTPHWIVNAVVVTATKATVEELARRPDVDVVEPDLVVEPILPVDPPRAKNLGDKGIGITPGVQAIQADRVWHELGIDGTGVIVGVLDTGVDGNHPALASRWQGNFAPASTAWLDAAGLGDTDFPVDQHYHGTHVMGTITGQAPDDSIGVAPGAHWIASNVINYPGTGPGFDNAVIASLEWMADPDGDPNTTADLPAVVQNSWGVNESFSGYYDCDSRWWDAIDNCEAAGVVLTWSAGNEGPGSTTLRSPADRATTPYNCFSVGSTIHSPPYTISSFSSRGPSGCGGAYATKPEVCAPGEDIYSAQPGGGYQYLSGTSMAGPHVAGVVALMRSANPDLDVITVKQILMDTATDLGDPGEDNTYGWGMVNAYDAVLAAMTGYGTVAGTVTDAVSGDPVAGALVDVAGLPRSTTTAVDGSYSIMLPDSSYTFDYSAFGYLPQSQSVTVLMDSTVTVDVALQPAPSALVYGTITDDAGNPVPGATVTAVGTPVAPATADSVGHYELSLPTGSDYTLLARAYGLGSQQATVTNLSADTQVDFVLPQLTFENFETGDFLSFGWTMGGDAPWTIDDTTAFEGTYSARSGDISDNQSSTLSVTVEVLAAGDISFAYKVSSESGYDYLRFAIDGVEQASWSGEVAWTEASFPVTAGTHTFTWSYTKDGSVSSGSDAGWIDYVVFPTLGLPAMTATPDSLLASAAPGGIVHRTVTLQNTGDGVLVFDAVANMDVVPAALQAPAPDLPKGAADTEHGAPQLLGSGGPDGYGYFWSDSDEPGGPTFNWVEINGVGTPQTFGDDSNQGPFPLGFTFNYYGVDYTDVRVCSNGFLSFTSTSTSYSNASIPNSAEPNTMLAPFWDDLNPSSGGTIYTYADTANARFIVEYEAVPRYGNSSALETFQVILNADGTILFQYLTMSDVTSATVGIENSDGTVGLQVVYNAAYIHDNLAIRFDFTPPPAPWLTVTPTSGSVPAGGSVDLQVTFDATDTPVGTYTGSIVVTGNVAGGAPLTIPATFIVSTSTAVGDDGLPTRFALGDAYPNPFNPSTRIRFAVPAGGGDVTLSVFDIRGRRVRTLVRGHRDGGYHTAVWNGDDDRGQRVASGTYFYRLEAPSFTETRKLVLVK